MKLVSLFSIAAVFCLLALPLKAQNQTMKLKITVQSKEFSATLNNSEAARELIKMLPLDVNMTEHNGNEKYYVLPNTMPGRAESRGRVEAGDLMIWSSNYLVLFYADARTSYSYITLGKLDNPDGLHEAVGRGNVRVKFELVAE